MYFLKRSWLLILIILFSYVHAIAQSLNGKVIHVSPSQIVMLKFHSVINNFNFTNKEANSLFQTRIVNNKNFSINSTLGNFKTTNLIIIEGENTHLFVLDYKETLDANESVYDFSNRKNLRAEADMLSKNVKKEVDSVRVTKDSTPLVPKVTEKPKLTQKEIDDNYSDIVTKANKAFSNKKFEEAKALYSAALELKPKDVWCVTQLGLIDNRKIVALKEDQQKISELAYQNHKRSADSAFNKKAYEAARFEYSQALKEKTNDPYSISQLKKIDQALKDDSYNSFMSIGRDAVSSQLFDNAVLAFNEALKIRPNDANAKKELGKINSSKASFLKKQKDDKVSSDQQSQYNDTLALADNMFEAGMYEDAKKKYKKADLMNPRAPSHKQKIASIDSILLLRKSAIGKLKQDSINASAYKNEIEKGKKYLDNKDFNKSRSAFQLAHSLQPSEKYPEEKLSEIDVMIMQAEESKKAEVAQKIKQDNDNKQYDFFIKRGNTAILSNDYIVAKDFFSKAHELKPAEKAPMDQLDLINRKLQEIRNNEKYEMLIHFGDSVAFNAKDYKASLKWFDSAGVLKPNETYPKKRIIYINQIMLQRDSILMENENTKERTAKYNEVADIYKKADAARLQRKYEDAYKWYAEFLNKIDQQSFNKYTAAQQYTIKQATEMLGRLQQYKPNLVADSLRNAHIQDSLNNIKPGKKKKKKG